MSFTTLLKLILEALPLVPDVEKFIEDLYAVVTKHTTAASQPETPKPPATDAGITAGMLGLATAGMLCLELLVMPQPAYAADINKPVKAVAAAPAPSPWYVGVWGGVGMSPTQNDLTVQGTAGGQFFGQTDYPTGVIAGAEFGYLNTSNPIIFGVNFDVGYDFNRGCIGVECQAQRKNGFLFQEGIEVGISPTTLFGYIPSQAQPANWPVPITVPPTLSSNVILLARGGYAERTLNLCGVVDAQNDTACGSSFIAAPYAGLDLKFMAAGNWAIGARWDHVFWGNQYSFTPGGFGPAFQGILVQANTTTIKHEDLLTIHLDYLFSPGTTFLGL